MKPEMTTYALSAAQPYETRTRSRLRPNFGKPNFIDLAAASSPIWIKSYPQWGRYVSQVSLSNALFSVVRQRVRIIGTIVAGALVHELPT